MKSLLKKYTIPVAIVALPGGVLALVWWMNGCESEDSWLYYTSFMAVIWSGWEAIPREKPGKS